MDIKWPVLGSIYVVSVILSILDWKFDLTFGPITFLAWLVAISGALAFIAWASYHIIAAFTGRGSGA